MTGRSAAILLGACLVLAGGCGTPVLAAAGPAVLTVRVAGGATRTVLHLQPGFATVIRADRRIDTVAIGDPRLVMATAVKHGREAQDLVLQPQAETGATNMVVWFGGLATVWELEIGPGRRTADIVYVVTAAGAAARSSSAPSAPAAPPPPDAEQPGREQAQAPPHTGTPGAEPAGPPLLEVRQSEGGVIAVFQAFRTQSGVLIRYRVTNGSGSDLTIRPGGVLVRVDGRVVPYGMARDSVDRGRPEIVPRGATETGVIEAPGRTPRQVQLVLSLFPVATDSRAPGVVLPFTFQPAFVGLDRLTISSDL